MIRTKVFLLLRMRTFPVRDGLKFHILKQQASHIIIPFVKIAKSPYEQIPIHIIPTHRKLNCKDAFHVVFVLTTIKRDSINWLHRILLYRVVWQKKLEMPMMLKSVQMISLYY